MRFNLPAKAAPKKIRHFDEEGPPIAAESRLELARERIEAVAGQVVVIANSVSQVGLSSRRFIVPTPSIRRLSTETLAKQIRHFDEDCASVSAKARFKLPAERIEAVATEIVVVADIEGCSRIRRPAKKKLALDIRGERIKVDAAAGKDKPGELVRGS